MDDRETAGGVSNIGQEDVLLLVEGPGAVLLQQ